ncbi:hypothetical protein GCM10028801_37530 [Nocardioides maradonensis]
MIDEAREVFVAKRTGIGEDVASVLVTALGVLLPWVDLGSDLGQRWLVQVRDTTSGEVVTARFALTRWGARRQARKVRRIIAMGGPDAAANFGGFDYS